MIFTYFEGQSVIKLRRKAPWQKVRCRKVPQSTLRQILRDTLLLPRVNYTVASPEFIQRKNKTKTCSDYWFPSRPVSLLQKFQIFVVVVVAFFFLGGGGNHMTFGRNRRGVRRWNQRDMRVCVFDSWKLLTLTNQARSWQRSKIYDITVHKKVRKRVCVQDQITLQSLATGPVPLGEKEIQHNYSVCVQLPCIHRNNDYIDLQKRQIYLAVCSYCFL